MMVGTTCSRVSHFINESRKMGFIHWSRRLQAHWELFTFAHHE
jgi:hypothetical protein